MGDRLLLDEPPLVILPGLALLVGVERALILQQIHYGLTSHKSGVIRDGYKWIWNTYEQWREKFPFWSVDVIRKHFKRLEDDGYLVACQFDKSDWDRKKYYRINYDKLSPLFSEPAKSSTSIRQVSPLQTGQIHRIDADKLTTSYKETENTTENTTEREPARFLNAEKPVLAKDSTPLAQNPEQKETELTKALKEVFPGHATAPQLMKQFCQLALSLNATATDIRSFPDWFHRKYPKSRLTPFAFKDHFAEMIKAKVRQMPQKKTYCGKCSSGYLQIIEDGHIYAKRCQCNPEPSSCEKCERGLISYKGNNGYTYSEHCDCNLKAMTA